MQPVGFPPLHMPMFAPAPLPVQELLVPAARPADEREASKVDKFVQYLVKNAKEGRDLEQEIRQREAGNPEFEFLFGGPHYRYYKWMLGCARIGYTANQRHSILLAYGQTIAQCRPGYLDLTHEQSNELSALLDSNRGTDADVKHIRQWTLDRSHCATAIGIILRRAVLQYVRTHSPEDGFTRALHTTYVLNDIFFNAPNVQTHEVTGLGDPKRPVDVIACMIDQVAPIIALGNQAAASEQQRAKLLQLPRLWLDVNLIQPSTYERCFGPAQLNAPIVGEPPIPPLTSPYVQNLPPPNLPPPPSSTRPPPPASQPPPHPPQQVQLGDLTNVSVGVMADVVRQALRFGQKRYYRPIDLGQLHYQPPSPTASSRMQDKLDNFLRFVDGSQAATEMSTRKSGQLDYR